MKPWLPALHTWLNWFLETPCSLCQRLSGSIFCADCQRQLQACQLPLAQQIWQSQPPSLAWGQYRDSLKRAIAALKYQHHPEVAQPLGQWLAQAWLQSAAKPQTTRLTVVPIPIHPSKQKQRGYNQAELLARSFCQWTGLPLRPQGLQRTRATTAQFGLSAADRATNLVEAFRVGRELRTTTHPILLLDDIYTTGATVRSAIQTLQQAGLQVSGVVVVAKAEMEKGEGRR